MKSHSAKYSRQYFSDFQAAAKPISQLGKKLSHLIQQARHGNPRRGTLDIKPGNSVTMAVAPPALDMPAIKSVSEGSHLADAAREGSVGIESEQRQEFSDLELEDHSASLSYEAPEKAAVDTAIAKLTPTSAILCGFDDIQKQVDAISYAVPGAGRQHVAGFEAQLDQLEDKAQHLYEAATARPRNERIAAYDQYLRIVDQIDMVKIRLDMLD